MKTLALVFPQLAIGFGIGVSGRELSEAVLWLVYYTIAATGFGIIFHRIKFLGFESSYARYVHIRLNQGTPLKWAWLSYVILAMAMLIPPGIGAFLAGRLLMRFW